MFGWYSNKTAGKEATLLCVTHVALDNNNNNNKFTLRLFTEPYWTGTGTEHAGMHSSDSECILGDSAFVRDSRQCIKKPLSTECELMQHIAIILSVVTNKIPYILKTMAFGSFVLLICYLLFGTDLFRKAMITTTKLVSGFDNWSGVCGWLKERCRCSDDGGFSGCDTDRAAGYLTGTVCRELLICCYFFKLRVW